MRDEKRIDNMLKKIKKIWKKYPDLRLFQLLINATGLAGHAELYYLEDDLFTEMLKNYDEIGG
jgi:uncharacterized protein YihD (DUF1040 family)